jgi:hypothetical protein
MYVIIEKSDRVYASFETKNHFKQAQEYRKKLRQLEPTVLDNECDLSQHGDNFYIVIPVKKAKIKKKRKAKKRASVKR